MFEMVGVLNEQQKSYVEKIMVGVESMSRMVTNLLDLGRIDAGVDLQVERTLIMDIVKAVMEPLQLIADYKDINCPSLPRLICRNRSRPTVPCSSRRSITW
jgi:signal transduction histidine kinase